MKRWIALILCLTAIISICGCGTEVNGDKSEITDFSLDAGETAFTTCWGYGIVINDEKSNHNDIGLTFAVNGSVVSLKISLLTMENYLTGSYNNAQMSETVMGAGYKTVSFSNLDSGTYVLMWEQMGTSQIQITDAAFTYVSDVKSVAGDDMNVDITTTEAGTIQIDVAIPSEAVPLAYAEELSVAALYLQSAEADHLQDETDNEKISLEDGKGSITISPNNVPSAEYSVVITKFTGYKKGESPLSISGTWTN